MPHFRIGLHKKVHQVAEHLFRRLGKKLDGLPAEINYPQRFPKGECFIIITVPLERQSVENVALVMAAHQHYHRKPTFITVSNGHYCPYLRLAYRFKDIEPDQQSRLNSHANMLVAWVEERFKIPAHVTPVPGSVELYYEKEIYTA